MPWNVVEVDIPEEEATANWSSQEQSAALYRVDELAKIISDGNDDCNPIKYTAVSSGAFCVSIANEIHIFDGERSNFLATVSLENSVDTMAWSPDSQFLVICDNSGSIHFFSFAYKNVVFSTKLVSVSEENGSPHQVFCNCAFSTSSEGGFADLTILSRDGCLFAFQGLPLGNLSEAITSKDLAMINKIKESIQMKTFEVSDTHDSVCYASVSTFLGRSSFLVAGSGSAAVSMWCGTDKSVLDTIDSDLLDGAGAVKCQESPDGKYLVIMDSQSNLSIWDAHALVMLSVPRSGVKDFTITSGTSSGEADVMGSDNGQVVLLAADENGETKLEICQFPFFQKTYSMTVTQECSLAESSCCQEKLYYVEEHTADSVNNNAAHLLYKCLSESSPEHRVFSLVRKKKFDSALEFSKAFGLDTEFVYKAKSSTILAEISARISESDESLDERAVSVNELIDELQENLRNVNSVEFCVDCCLKASPPKLEQVYRLLSFAKEKLGVSDKHNAEMTDVLTSIYRLETFKMVFGDACFSVHKWRQFCKGDMLSQVMKFLSQGKMSDAAIIWRRHQSELEENLSPENLQSVLVAIRSDLPSSTVISWLREYLIPFVVCCPNNKESLFVVASWLEQRITALELSEKENWPSNGLEMAKLLFDVHSNCAQESSNYENIPPSLLVNQIYGVADIQVYKRVDTPNPISKLLLMLEHLAEMEKLHIDYHCKVPLAEFTKETSLGIMFKMLDSVLFTELIPRIVNGQITQYGIQHGFQIDDVLLKYISNQVTQVSVTNTLHEARLVEITNCIKARSLRLEATLQLMSWATVPWSSVMEEMVRKAMIEDPSNEKLKWSYRLMELNKIISNYGIRGIEFSNDSHIKGVVKYILATSNKTALKDALQIAESYRCVTEEDVYYIRLQNLCLKGLVVECIESLDMIDKSKVKSVVKEFLTWVSVILEDDLVDEDSSQERIDVTKVCISILEHLRDVHELSIDEKSLLEDLKNILALQIEFSISISISDYRELTTRECILLNYVKENEMSTTILTKSDMGINEQFATVSRLARLFGLSVIQLQTKILLHSLPDSVTSWENCLKNIEHELSPEEIFDLCNTIFLNYITQSQDIDRSASPSIDVYEMLHRLISCASTRCDASSLGSYLELCKLSWLSTSFNAHCESGGFNLPTSICEDDPLQSWSNSEWFKDNGFVLDANVALPLLHQVLAEDMLVLEDPQGHLTELTVACRKLVRYLEENNLHELALQYALHCLGHLLQFSATDSTGDNSSEEQCDEPEQGAKAMLLSKMGALGCSHVADMLVHLSSKVLQSSCIDQNVALGYLCSIPEDTAISKLKNDYAIGQCHTSSQVITVFRVALHYAVNFCQSSTITAVEELFAAALWHARLTKLCITSGNLLISDKKEARKVLEILLEKREIDVKIIVEFCRTFGLEVDEAMHAYIRNIGNKTCDPTPESVQKFEDNLLCAISYIVTVATLLGLLTHVLESLSPYDYQRINIILNAMIKYSSDTDETQYRRQLEVLNILKKYQRRVTPHEYEKDFCVSGSCASVEEQTEVLSQQSQERLPFHPLFYGYPWKIIAQELNDETIPKLLPLCGLLKLQDDQVYVNAVNNLVSSFFLEKQPCADMKDSTSSNVELTRCQFEKAARLLSAVKNPEVAVKTAIMLLSKWPQSEEKVKAANATVQLASKWVAASEADDLATAEKICKIATDNARVITIEHILISGGITDQSFFILKHKPAKLLMHLYKVYGCAPETNRPNIHKIATEIAAISNLNINKIHSYLLDTWLHSAYHGSFRSPEYAISQNKADDRDNLKRVMYLLEDVSLQKKYALFLLNFAYKSGQSKISYQSRVRAMEVLFNVASHEVIQDLANDTLEGIRNYMKSLFYLSELEYLHLPQTVESFQRCNKEGLVKGLWKNHKDNPNAILLIADIYLDSKMCDPQVWTNILRQLFHLGMTKYLGYLLPQLSKFLKLWQTSNLMKIWGELAVQPMTKAVIPLSTEDRHLCDRSMLLLQKCPIIGQVDIVKIFQKLVELGLLQYALACYPLLPQNKRPRCLESLIRPDNVIEILDATADDEAIGRGFVSPGVVETVIYEHVTASGLYEPFIGSDHLTKFVAHLASVNKLRTVILEMLKRNDLELAIELAQHYESRGSPVKKTYRQQEQLPGFNDLLCFLDTAGVLDEASHYLPAFEDSDADEERPALDLEPDEQVSVHEDIFNVF